MEPAPFDEPAPFAASAPAEDAAPEPTPSDAPFTPVFEFEPVKPARVRDEVEPADVPPFAIGFPPGSVQSGVPAEPAPESGANPFAALSEPAQPEPTPAPQADAASGIDEIRRLAAEAMSGIERAGHANDPAPSHATPAAGLFAPGDDAAVPTPDGFANVQSPATPQSGAFPQVNPVVQEPVGFAPVNPASGGFAQVNQPEPAPEPAPEPQLQPQPGPQPESNPWELHPLEQAPAPKADPNDFTPVATPEQPDFSALYQAAPQQPMPQQSAPFAPVTGTSPTVPPSAVLPTSGQFPTSPFGAVSPTASGQIPTESLATGTFRRPEVPAGPGPRDFKWLHLGVIAALMFVLGVFIYNVAFNQ